MEEEILKVSPSSVAQALAADYFCIYYVNTDNDHFIEYSASPEYRRLGLPRESDNFVLFSRENFEHVIDPRDRVRFLSDFTKDKVLKALDAQKTYTLTFRMLFDGAPVHVHLKVTRMLEAEGHHVVIGISSVEEQMRQQEAYRRAEEDRMTYSRVAQALAADYFSIYVVDPDTDRFTEYSSTDRYQELDIEKSGEDFFAVSRRNMGRVIYEGDRDRFMKVFTKENLMSILEQDGSFTMKYRLMFGQEPVYVSMKASLLSDKDGRQLIIGTNNIDAQMKREEDYQRRMADARNQAKNDFLANMSHDMRTPMNAIVGYTNIARSHPDQPEVVRDALAKIGSSSHFLLSLINDVLDMSKIESGKMQLTLGECDLMALLQRIEDITSLQARDKSLRIRYDRSRIRHHHVRGDELRIEQILINIISNSIKYTPQGKSVDLLAEELEEDGSGKARYRFVIRDTGIGISEEYLPYIFDSFSREKNTTINKIQGTGLGLAITARIVEQMGGTISVRSEVGVGSEFTVELPLELLEAPGTEEDTAAAVPETELAGCRVLLVEDNDINAEVAQMILEQYGISVDREENGRKGVEKLLQAGDSYDAVLMDIQMPVMNGYEAARAIREQAGAYGKRVPIIAMSANAYTEDVERCLEAGMNAHIAKPYSPDELVLLLRRYLKPEK